MKTTGWVLYDTEEKKYVAGCYGTVATKLPGARVFDTRNEARSYKLGVDRVHKVRIKGGVAVAIIPGR